MANKNKAKGTRWETALVRYLKKRGLDVYRPAQAGAKDTGDIHGLPNFAIQAKAYKSVTDAVREGTKGVEQQRLNLGAPFGVSFVKAPHQRTEHGYAVMRIDRFVDFLQEVMPWAFSDRRETE